MMAVNKYQINKTSKKIVLTTNKKNKYVNKLNKNTFINNPVTKQITVRAGKKNYKVLANAYLEKIIINKTELSEAENKDIKLVFKTRSEETTEIILAENTSDLITEINKNINPRYWYLDYTGEVLNVLIADFINTVLLDLQDDMETLALIVENIVTDLPFVPNKSYSSWIEELTVNNNVIVAEEETGKLFSTDLYFLDENNNQVIIDTTNNNLLFNHGLFIYNVTAKINNTPVNVTFDKYCNTIGGVNYFRPTITIIEDESTITLEDENILSLEFINPINEQSFSTEYKYIKKTITLSDETIKTLLQPEMYCGGQETVTTTNIEDNLLTLFLNEFYACDWLNTFKTKYTDDTLQINITSDNNISLSANYDGETYSDNTGSKKERTIELPIGSDSEPEINLTVTDGTNTKTFILRDNLFLYSDIEFNFGRIIEVYDGNLDIFPQHNSKGYLLAKKSDIDEYTGVYQDNHGNELTLEGYGRDYVILLDVADYDEYTWEDIVDNCTGFGGGSLGGVGVDFAKYRDNNGNPLGVVAYPKNTSSYTAFQNLVGTTATITGCDHSAYDDSQFYIYD